MSEKTEIKIIHKNGQPYGIRDSGGYLLFFPTITKYDNQEQRYLDEVKEAFDLAEKILLTLQSTPSPALQDAVKEIAIPSIEHLLDLSAKYGGKIVSTASLSDYEIKQAIASGRMFVNESCLGYVWIPNEDDIFPETIEGVKQFEEWYPLDVELPDELKDFNNILAKMNKPSA